MDFKEIFQGIDNNLSKTVKVNWIKKIYLQV